MRYNISSCAVLEATFDDVDGISDLLSHYAALGDLLPRSKQDVIENIEHFVVIKENEKVVACGSLEHFTDELAEIRSLMVQPNLKRSGHGKRIVQHLIERAKSRCVKRLMALTYVPAFFHQLGFITVEKDIFPEKIWGICINCYKFNNCDEIAVLLHL